MDQPDDHPQSELVETLGEKGDGEPTLDTKLHTNDRIKFKTEDMEDFATATILGRAGKAKGINKHWYNIRNEQSGRNMSIDTSTIVWEKVANAETEEVNVVDIPKPLQDQAKAKELQKLKDFNTYTVVKN